MLCFCCVRGNATFVNMTTTHADPLGTKALHSIPWESTTIACEHIRSVKKQSQSANLRMWHLSCPKLACWKQGSRISPCTLASQNTAVSHTNKAFVPVMTCCFQLARQTASLIKQPAEINPHAMSRWCPEVAAKVHACPLQGPTFVEQQSATSSNYVQSRKGVCWCKVCTATEGH